MTLYIIIALVGVGVGIYFSRSSASSDGLKVKSGEELDEMRGEAQEALHKRTEERKAKVLEYIAEEEKRALELAKCSAEPVPQGVTSASVAKELRVSTETALRYINELEAEGKLEQVGSNGPHVCYRVK